jgi:hypothetical protein
MPSFEGIFQPVSGARLNVHIGSIHDWFSSRVDCGKVAHRKFLDASSLRPADLFLDRTQRAARLESLLRKGMTVDI